MDDNLLVYNIFELYNFIKTWIYFIIIHQQQVKGLFNKLDLRKLLNILHYYCQLNSLTSLVLIGKDNLLEGLKEIKANQKKKSTSLTTNYAWYHLKPFYYIICSNSIIF